MRTTKYSINLRSTGNYLTQLSGLLLIFFLFSGWSPVRDACSGWCFGLALLLYSIVDLLCSMPRYSEYGSFVLYLVLYFIRRRRTTIGWVI